MSETTSEVDATTAEPQDEFEQYKSRSESGGVSVEFSIDDTNNDYAKGVFLRNARNLQSDFVELYKEEPKAKFRLTLERL